MACARFFPEMYHRFLEGKIAIPSEEEKKSKSAMELAHLYPYYAMFMSIHLGKAFSEATIDCNVEAIAEISKEYLISVLGPSDNENKELAANEPTFWITCGELQNEYGIDIDGEDRWD